jgi:hypothetical protein
VVPLVNEGQRSRRWEKESGGRKEREVGIVRGMVCTRRGGGVKMPALLRRFAPGWQGWLERVHYSARLLSILRCNFACWRQRD